MLRTELGHRWVSLARVSQPVFPSTAIAIAAKAASKLSAAQIIDHRAERADSAAALAEPSAASVTFPSSVLNPSN